MNASLFSTKVARLMLASLLTCGLLALVAFSLSGAAVNAAPLNSYPGDGDLLLRWITVTASGGVVVSDTQPGEAPGTGSKKVYFNDLASGTIIVTPDVTGTAPLMVTRARGLDGATLVVSTTKAPLIEPMPDGPIALVGTRNVTFALQNNFGTLIPPLGSASTVFTLSFVEDNAAPTAVGIVAPAAGAVLTGSAQSPYTIVMTATDEGSGIKSVQVIPSANGIAQLGSTYGWTLPTEDNAPYTLLMTATDYVGNYMTATRSITVDRVAPTAATPLVNNGVFWTPTSTLVFTWTPSADKAGILRYELLITDSEGSTQQPAVAGNVQMYTLTPAAKEEVGYRASLRAVDQNGNVGPWSAASTVITPDLQNPVVEYGLPPVPVASGKVYPLGPTIYYSDNVNVNIVHVEVTATDNLSLTGVTAGSAPNGWTFVSNLYPAPNTWRFGYLQTSSSVNATELLTITGHDASGRSASRIFTFTVDGASPLATVIAAPAYFSTTSGSSITLTYHATDAQSGLKQVVAHYSLDGGGAWTSTNQTKSYSTYTPTVTDMLGVPVAGLLDGVYAWKVVATDNLGNSAGVPIGSGDITTTYDTHAPIIGLVTSPPDSGVSPINVNWAASDSPAGIQSVTLWVRPPGSGWITSTTTTTNATTGTWVYSFTYGYGVYDFYVQVADRAGNIMPVPVTPQASTNYNPGVPQTHAAALTAYTNTKPLTITWVATSATSNLSVITLCVSSALSPMWQAIPITTLVGEISQANGPATYDPPTDDIYYFAIGASTSTGQQMRCPINGTGNVSITYDTQISATTSLTVTPTGWTNHNSFTLIWITPADLSGINNVKYLLGNTSPTSPSVGTAIGLTTTTVVTAPNQGQNNLWLWVEDRAGNSSYTRAQSVTLQYDSISPTVTLTLPKTFPAHKALITWAGDDANSGLASYTLAYLGSDNSSNSYTLPPTATAQAIPVTYGQTYMITLTAYDAAGNYTRTIGSVAPALPKVYLPLALNNYLNCISVDTEPNNDYAHAQNLTGWSATSGGQTLTASGNFCPASDTQDYFKITTPANNALSLKLSVPSGTNLNLYGYDQSGTNQVFSAVSPAGNKSILVQLPAGSGAPYYLEVRRMDTVFNQAHAQPYTLEVSDIETLVNGSFEEGAGNAVTGWTLSNVGLPAAPVTGVQDGSALFGARAVLLGNPALGCRSMPLGYAEVKQTFFVPNVSQALSLKYRYIIFTHDSVGSVPALSPSSLDRFEVYVQGAAAEQLAASDGNTLNVPGCSNLRRVPGADNIREQDGTWAVKSVSLDAYKGQFVTVIFRNYSRLDKYYNTYTYLDKIELVSP